MTTVETIADPGSILGTSINNERNEVGEKWDRRKGETAKAYSAFVIYRDLGPTRTFAAAYRERSGRTEDRDKTGIPVQPPGYYRGWYDDKEWKLRAEAWDAQRDADIRKAIQEAYRAGFEKLADSTLANVAVLLSYALGIRTKPEIGDGQEAVDHRLQLAAVRDALDRLGIKAPERIALDAADAATPLSSWADLLALATSGDEEATEPINGGNDV